MYSTEITRSLASETPVLDLYMQLWYDIQYNIWPHPNDKKYRSEYQTSCFSGGVWEQE